MVNNKQINFKQYWFNTDTTHSLYNARLYGCWSWTDFDMTRWHTIDDASLAASNHQLKKTIGTYLTNIYDSRIPKSQGPMYSGLSDIINISCGNLEPLLYNHPLSPRDKLLTCLKWGILTWLYFLQMHAWWRHQTDRRKDDMEMGACAVSISYNA